MTNPQPPNPEDLLQDLLEGRLQARLSDPSAGELAGLAARVRHLRPPGPAPAARHRMVARLNATFEGRSRRDFGTWLLGWLGLGHQPRAVTQRFAAGALLLSAMGSGAAAATDTSPLDAITGIARFAETAFLSLSPGSNLPTSDGTEVEPVAATATPTAATAAVTPGSGGTPAPSSTPQPGSSTPGTGPAGGSNGTSGSGDSGTPAGGSSPSPAATSTSGPSATPTPTGTPSTTVPGGTPSPTATRTPTPSTTPDDGDGTPTPTKTPSPTPTPTPSPTPSPTPTPIPGTLYSVTLGGFDAGWVRVLRTGDTLTVTEVIANPGWTYTIDTTPSAGVEVKFENTGSGTTLDFHAEIEDGVVKTTVKQE